MQRLALKSSLLYHITRDHFIPSTASRNGAQAPSASPGAGGYSAGIES